MMRALNFDERAQTGHGGPLYGVRVSRGRGRTMASRNDFRSGGRGHGGGGDADAFDPAMLSPFALHRLVEGEIIPRLLLAHRGIDAGGVNGAAAPIDVGTAERFALAALRQEAYGLLVEVDALIARGHSVEAVFLDILAPAARHLGELWDADACDFVDVTMALWRLQEIVHELAARTPGAAERRGGERRALFAPLPGEQHGFGSLMVEEFFRRAGWTTASEPGASEADLTTLVGSRWFEIVGLTVSVAENVARLPAIIAALRAASRNPRLGVLVGGRVFIDHPDWADGCGADATALDARQAVLVAESLLDVLALRADTPIAGHG